MTNILKKFLSVFFILVLSLVLFLKYNDYLFNEEVPQVDLVQGFPDVPQISKTKLVASNKEVTKKSDRYNGVWQTPDSVPSVVNWYLKDLPSNNWIVDVLPANINATDIQYLTAVKDNLYLQLSIVRKGKITEITANVTNKNSNK